MRDICARSCSMRHLVVPPFPEGKLYLMQVAEPQRRGELLAEGDTLLSFGALRAATGLSQQEAADFLAVRLDTVKQWSSGRRSAPVAIVDRLRDLLRRQEVEAARLALVMEGQPLEPHLLKADAEAMARGWPSMRAYNVMAARAWSLAAKPH